MNFRLSQDRIRIRLGKKEGERLMEEGSLMEEFKLPNDLRLRAVLTLQEERAEPFSAVLTKSGMTCEVSRSALLKLLSERPTKDAALDFVVAGFSFSLEIDLFSLKKKRS